MATKFQAQRRERGEFPATDAEFFEQFGTEQQCLDFIVKTRWPHGFVCPKCSNRGRWIATEQVWHCDAGHSVSATCETAMHRTRTPLRTWFYSAWLICTHKPGVSALQMAARKTKSPGYMGVWGTLHKIRDRMDQHKQRKLSGYVEADEMYVGGEERGTGHTGRGAVTKTLVAVAVEVVPWKDDKGVTHARAGRCRMRVIRDAKQTTLEAFIADSVDSGATVSTDAASSYGRVINLGYDHDVTVAKYDDDPLPTLGRVTTNLKRWLIGTHKGAVRKAHLQAYLNEYVFRFNSRFRPWDAFAQLLGLAAKSERSIEYRELFAHVVHPNRGRNFPPLTGESRRNQEGSTRPKGR